MRVIDYHGAITPVGVYHYQTIGRVAPNKSFDYSQEPLRRGTRVQIKLLDGSMATIRDGDKRRWRFFKLGWYLYRHSKEYFVVTLSVTTTFVIVSGSIYSDATVRKSTATSLERWEKSSFRV